MTKTALVTGAARGIGLATTRQFIAEGWNVAMIDRDGEALFEAAGGLADADPGGARPFICDVSDPDAVAAMMASTRLGRRATASGGAPAAASRPTSYSPRRNWRFASATCGRN